MQLQVVAPSFVHQLWGKVEDYFVAAYSDGFDDCTIEQLKHQLAMGVQTLVVVIDNGEICGAATISLQTLPNHRVAVVTAAGGTGIINADIFEQVATWAKSQGATKIRAWAKESQARLYRQKVGLNATYSVVEKLI